MSFDSKDELLTYILKMIGHLALIYLIFEETRDYDDDDDEDIELEE